MANMIHNGRNRHALRTGASSPPQETNAGRSGPPPECRPNSSRHNPLGLVVRAIGRPSPLDYRDYSPTGCGPSGVGMIHFTRHVFALCAGRKGCHEGPVEDNPAHGRETLKQTARESRDTEKPGYPMKASSANPGTSPGKRPQAGGKPRGHRSDKPCEPIGPCSNSPAQGPPNMP